MQISTIAIIGGSGKIDRRILGRQPKDFFAYARQTAATGIWSVQS